MPLEKEIENKVVKWAAEHGFLTPKVKFVDGGYPDRLFISPHGHTVFIEFKRPGEEPERLQHYRLNQLQRRCIPAYWTDNYHVAISILKACLEPASISGTGDKNAVRASVGRAVLGSGARKDLDRVSDLQDFKGARVGEEDANHRPSSPDVQGVAGRDQEVE